MSISWMLITVLDSEGPWEALFWTKENWVSDTVWLSLQLGRGHGRVVVWETANCPNQCFWQDLHRSQRRICPTFTWKVCLWLVVILKDVKSAMGTKVLSASFFPDCPVARSRCVWPSPDTSWCCPEAFFLGLIIQALTVQWTLSCLLVSTTHPKCS